MVSYANGSAAEMSAETTASTAGVITLITGTEALAVGQLDD